MDGEKGIGGGCLLQPADGGAFHLAGGGNRGSGLAFSTRGAKAERDSAAAFGARGGVNRVHLAGVVAALPGAAAGRGAAWIPLGRRKRCGGNCRPSIAFWRRFCSRHI